MVYYFEGIYLSVGLSVCNTITYESVDVASSYLHIQCIFMGYRSS